MKRFVLTSQHIRTLQVHQERTGVGPYALLSGRRRELPKGLSASTINTWFSFATQTARVDHYETVLALWKAHESLVPVTFETCSEIRDCLSRSRYSLRTIMALRAGRPQGCGFTTVEAWLSGKTHLAKASHLHFVLEAVRLHAVY